MNTRTIRNLPFALVMLFLFAFTTSCRDSDSNWFFAPALSTPSSLKAESPSSFKVILEWKDDNANKDGIEIERSTNAVDYSVVGDAKPGQNAFTDVVLVSDKIYHYRVRAYQGTSYSKYSNIISIATLNGPTDLEAAEVSDTEVRLTWSDNSSLEEGYSIERSGNGVDFIQIDTVPADTAMYDDTGLPPETDCWYRVRAYNLGGSASDFSNVDPVMTPIVPWACSFCGGMDDMACGVAATASGGYIMAGTTESFGTGLSDAWVLKIDAKGNVEWEKAYGVKYDDYGHSIAAKWDGSFVVAGDETHMGPGVSDAWVFKIDSDGNLLWQWAYGGADHDHAGEIATTADGGYIVAGHTSSFGAGSTDCWILKLRGNGEIQWQKTYGGAMEDYGRSIAQTEDGGYIVAGSTTSYGQGFSDFWVMKLNALGEIVWQNTYGGALDEYARSIVQAKDGGYIVAGESLSFSHNEAAWILKLRSDGRVAWQKAYSGQQADFVRTVREAGDGGILVAGETFSFGQGEDDSWALKLDSEGAVEWEKVYGGSLEDSFLSFFQTEDRGIVAVGSTSSFGTALSDCWTLKLNPNGTIVFNGTSGAVVEDTTAKVIVTNVQGEESFATSGDTSAVPVKTNARVLDTTCTKNQQAP